MIRPPVAALLVIIAAAPAASQELAEVPLDCEGTPGGAQCRVTAEEVGALLYCVAYGASGDPVGNTTVAAADGIAALNGVRVEEIATMRCRVE